MLTVDRDPARPFPAELRFEGELDVSTVSSVRGSLAQALLDGHLEISLNLEAVTFIDCATVGSLVWARNQVSARGGRMRVRTASTAVDRILALTHTGDVLGRPPVGAPLWN